MAAKKNFCGILLPVCHANMKISELRNRNLPGKRDYGVSEQGCFLCLMVCVCVACGVCLHLGSLCP